ncbi:serine hydrolase [Microbacterium sp. NPDC089695]|uniref:serine hydrolase n=1 Tax=Microbacterium sp. NPDC089695 TaxID=3364198 RepID=UPI0038059DB9
MKDDDRITEEIDAIFTAVGLEGFLIAEEIGASGRSIELRADEPVVLASVFKIPIFVAFARAVADGVLDPAETATVTSEYRTGGVGTGGAKDDVTASLRDLAELMMTLSDNAATDVIFDRVGQAAVDEVVTDAGLTATRIVGRCVDHLAVEAAHLRGIRRPGLDPHRENPWSGVTPAELLTLPTLDPASGLSVSTPRDIALLLRRIWQNELASAQACADTRAAMSRQKSTARIPSGFLPAVRVAGKTGTLEGIRNEASVVTYPDGRAFAVAIFTRSEEVAERQPEHDRAMGAAARLVVDALRREGNDRG